MHRTTSVPIANLQASIAGRVLTPDDAAYEDARTMFMGGFSHRPAAIVRVANTSDVARVIAIARDSGIELAVRSGGHSGAGHSITDGGIVLDLHDMKALEIDTAARTAWAETGLTAAEYSAGVGAHGLATGFGDTGSVGIGGITLAGGIGYLTRKYGMTIDSVLGAEIVTAGGTILQVNAASHPDLFWALRGGGGNFGVVTRFHYRLHRVDHIVGGLLLLPATPEAIVQIVDAAESAPEELTAIVNVMPAPPMPFVPESHHGRLSMMILLCYAGDADAGARAVAPFRTIVEPIADLVRPMTYPEIFPPEDPSYHPLAIGRTLFMDRVDRAAAEMMIDFLQRSDAPLRVAQIRPLGGAMARVRSDATAFAHRDRRILTNVAAFYLGNDDRPVKEAWTNTFAAALSQGGPGAYVAFVNDEAQSRVRDAYPQSTWSRLAAIKARYDPENVFRRNHNVPPQAA